MTLEPFGADVREHLRWVKGHKEIVLRGEVSLLAALNLLHGFNAGTGYSLLRGFEEWLIVEIGKPEGFAHFWSGLLRESIAMQRAASEDSADEDAAAVDQMFEIVDRFLEDWSHPDSTRSVYQRYEELRAAPA